MNTQLNSAQPTITLDNISLEVLLLISDLVQEVTERDPEYAQDLAAFNEAIKAAREVLSREQLSVLENAPWCFSSPYGNAMFMEGVRIGRDPLSVLTLPEGKTIR